jgi:tetratricopeptide (TPR) repeat protein
MILLLSLLAAGQSPELAIAVGGHAEVTRMPTVDAGITELSLRGVQGDLSELRGRHTPGIRNIDAVSRGGGIWLLRVRTEQEDTRIEASIQQGELLLTVLPGARPAPAPRAAVPDLKALLSGALSDEPGDELPELFFLHGEALADRMTPADYPLGFAMPGWLEASTRADLDAARKRMLAARACGASCEEAYADALYEVGWRYIALGWNREGHHYLGWLSDHPGSIDPAQIALSQAHSAIATRRYDLARQRLAEAADLGAPESAVVEGLAVVSLATGAPAYTPTARLLASLTGDPQAMLLVGELLQLDDRFAESVPYLKKGHQAAEGVQQARAALRLGDAALVAGDIDSARAWWQTAPPDIATYRAIYGELSRLGPAAWVSIAPQLRELSRGDDPVASEALYLLARIDADLGIDVDAIADLTRLLDTWPRLVEESDAPAILWRLYKSRARRLHEAGSWYRLAALHESAWRPLLMDEIDDPTPLWQVSAAYEALGLPRAAIEALSLGLESVISSGGQAPEMTLHLARLYEDSGACADGLKTLRFLKSGGTSLPRGELDLMTGRMLVACERQDEALPYLRRARESAGSREEAAMILATLDAQAGRCRAAIEPLKTWLASDAADWSRSDSGILLVRCLAAEGRLTEAAETADAITLRSSSAETRRYASYLAALYRGTPGAVEPDEDIWSAVSAERASSEALEEMLRRRQE